MALSREGKQEMSETHSTIRGGQRLLWYTERLWRLAEKLPPFEISICGVPELDQNCWFDGSEPTLRRVAEHCARINDGDLGRRSDWKVDDRAGCEQVNTDGSAEGWT